MQEQYAARQEHICKGEWRVEARAGPVSTKTQPSNDKDMVHVVPTQNKVGQL